MAEFTEAQVTEALEKIVAEAGPGFIYKESDRDEYGYFPGDCMYFEGGEPSCIVGHLIDALDMPHDIIPEGMPISVGYVKKHLEEYFHPAVIDALRKAQRTQDAGGTWGCALDRYKKGLAG